MYGSGLPHEKVPDSGSEKGDSLSNLICDFSLHSKRLQYYDGKKVSYAMKMKKF